MMWPCEACDGAGYADPRHSDKLCKECNGEGSIDDNAKKVVSLRAEVARLRALLREDMPWPLRDVVARLADAADHLLCDHSCDAHGHEGVRICVVHARDWLAELAKGAE